MNCRVNYIEHTASKSSDWRQLFPLQSILEKVGSLRDHVAFERLYHRFCYTDLFPLHSTISVELPAVSCYNFTSGKLSVRECKVFLQSHTTSGWQCQNWNPFLSLVHCPSCKAPVDSPVIRNLVRKCMNVVMYMKIHFNIVYSDTFLEET